MLLDAVGFGPGHDQDVPVTTVAFANAVGGAGDPCSAPELTTEGQPES